MLSSHSLFWLSGKFNQRRSALKYVFGVNFAQPAKPMEHSVTYISHIGALKQ